MLGLLTFLYLRIQPPPPHILIHFITNKITFLSIHNMLHGSMSCSHLYRDRSKRKIPSVLFFTNILINLWKTRLKLIHRISLLSFFFFCFSSFSSSSLLSFIVSWSLATCEGVWGWFFSFNYYMWYYDIFHVF